MVYGRESQSVGYLFDSSGGKALVELGGHKSGLQEEDS